VLVCHCRRVSDAQIATAVSAGAHDPRSVVRATHAGTGCGGCLQSLRAVIEQALGPALTTAATAATAAGSVGADNAALAS
jgi:bacterioferritin-associated ferredoxin